MHLDSLILTIRDQKVILDADLAGVYGVATKVLNQAVKRNIDRFPDDFMFRLKSGEWQNLRSQFVTSSLEHSDNKHDALNRSQIVTGSQKHRGTLPYVFTEHGALMAANVLNSP